MVGAALPEIPHSTTVEKEMTIPTGVCPLGAGNLEQNYSLWSVTSHDGVDRLFVSFLSQISLCFNQAFNFLLSSEPNVK